MKRFACGSFAGVLISIAASSAAQPASQPPAAPQPPAAGTGAPTSPPPQATPAPTSAGSSAGTSHAPPPPPTGAPPPLLESDVRTGEGPPAYYVEPPPADRPYEPPIPGHQPGMVWEPPPPPEPRHVAPKTSLWLGARLGWFFPFGYLFSQAVEVDRNIYDYYRVSWTDYAGPGPLFEIDVGARLARNYNVFLLWERAELSRGDASPDVFNPSSKQRRGSTNYWGAGLRATSDPNGFGFLSEVTLGYRTAALSWENGSELELSSSILEARLGVGADLRINEFFTLSPMFTFGIGTFTTVDRVSSEGETFDQIGRLDEYDGHGWVTLQLGAHFDLLRQK